MHKLAGIPLKYKESQDEAVQRSLVFPTEGESTREEYRLNGMHQFFIVYNVFVHDFVACTDRKIVKRN